ncbi:hypothetical protein B0H11DRAFT_2245034 [Mycena galericulata]|nr:hypothetical protein B0H11DRAFT_2245034 [Mycena galericulata]
MTLPPFLSATHQRIFSFAQERNACTNACTRMNAKAHDMLIQCTKGKCPKLFHISCAEAGGPAGIAYIITSCVIIASRRTSRSRWPPHRYPRAPAALVLPPLLRKIRVSAGVFKVTLMRVLEEHCSVEVWDAGDVREFKWDSIILGAPRLPTTMFPAVATHSHSHAPTRTRRRRTPNVHPVPKAASAALSSGPCFPNANIMNPSGNIIPAATSVQSQNPKTQAQDLYSVLKHEYWQYPGAAYFTAIAPAHPRPSTSTSGSASTHSNTFSYTNEHKSIHALDYATQGCKCQCHMSAPHLAVPVALQFCAPVTSGIIIRSRSCSLSRSRTRNVRARIRAGGTRAAWSADLFCVADEGQMYRNMVRRSVCGNRNTCDRRSLSGSGDENSTSSEWIGFNAI